MRKIHINEGQLVGLLGESEWNFHFGKDHDLSPYGSDNKYQMAGRETGHFGSGTYFSTYKGKIDNYSDEIDPLNDKKNLNPNFIEIANHLYRVDFDIYRNLYRVRSKRQGDVLFTMCSELNRMYNKIAYMGNFSRKNAIYDNSENYQIIKRNAEVLGLECPSYYELTRMAQRHDGKQSFSTLFMEWNGYNGVNVSGVEYYDNTKHGSVIYDLSKVSGEMKEVNVKMPFWYREQPYNNTIAYDAMRDYELSALNGEYISWHDKLNEMPMPQALRVLKNFTKSGNVLSPYNMKSMNKELRKRYLRLLYSVCMSNSEVFNTFGDYSDGKIKLSSWFNDRGVLEKIMDYDNCKYFVKLILEDEAYYWANCLTRGKSMLTEMLWGFSNELSWSLSNEEEINAKKEFLEKVMGAMNRKLTEYEKEFIEEDYYE